MAITVSNRIDLGLLVARPLSISSTLSMFCAVSEVSITSSGNAGGGLPLRLLTRSGGGSLENTNNNKRRYGMGEDSKRGSVFIDWKFYCFIANGLGQKSNCFWVVFDNKSDTILD